MTGNRGTSTATSVRDRLLELARQRNQDFQLILTRYGLERFLYRLSQSEYRVASMPFGLAFGYSGSLDQFAIFYDAIACGVRVGNLALNSKIDSGLEDMAEMADCRLRTACSPYSSPYTKARIEHA